MDKSYVSCIAAKDTFYRRIKGVVGSDGAHTRPGSSMLDFDDRY